MKLESNFTKHAQAPMNDLDKHTIKELEMAQIGMSSGINRIYEYIEAKYNTDKPGAMLIASCVIESVANLFEQGVFDRALDESAKSLQQVRKDLGF